MRSPGKFIKDEALPLCLIAIFGGLVFVMVGGPQSCARRRQFEGFVKSANHHELLTAAVSVIRVATNHTVYKRDDIPPIAELPLVISEMNPSYVSVESNRMRIEFHGGFNHYGFKVLKDENWQLSWYTEHGTHPIISERID